MSNDAILTILYIIMGALLLVLIILCIPWMLGWVFDRIVELKDEWELFKFRMRGDR